MATNLSQANKKAFPEWQPEDAKAAIPTASGTKVHRLFYEGDHWQNGTQWIGPMPIDPATGAPSQIVMTEIEEGHVSKNVIKEIADRRAGGAIGKEPYFSWIPKRLKKGEEPSEEEKTLMEEANQASTAHWNDRDLHSILERGTICSIVNRHGSFRVFVPEDLIQTEIATDEDGTEYERSFVEAGTIEEALEMIWVEHPDPKECFVYTVPNSKRQIGIFVYQDVDDQERIEVCYIDYDGEDRQTIIRIMDQERPEGASTPVALGGRLTMYTMHHEEFITDQIVSLQNALNLGLTMMPRGMTTSGFLERVLLNAQMPGEWSYNDNGDPIPGTFKPAAYVTGAGTTNFVRGIDYQETTVEGDVVTKVANPAIEWRDPTSLEPLIQGNEHFYAQILDTANQAHFLLAKESSPSGRSRAEARAEFTATARRTAKNVNAAGRWLVETVMAWAEYIIGDPGKYTKTLRCDFTCRIDSGPLSAEEQKVIAENVEGRLIPREMGMSQIGVDDTGAAMAEIQAQPDSMLELRVKQGEALAAFHNAGVPLEIAAVLAGLDEEDIEKVVRLRKKMMELYGDGTGVQKEAENAQTMAEATMKPADRNPAPPEPEV